MPDQHGIGGAPARSDAGGAAVDAPDFGSLAWLRRASGDTRLRPWCLTPERLGAYAAGVRALATAGPAIQEADPGAVLDPDRQPLLRPWETGDPFPQPSGRDPARAITELLEVRPAVAATIRPHVRVDEFVAAHLKLIVCVRALVLLAGDDAMQIAPDRVRAWADARQPRAGAEADFAASLVTAVEGRPLVDEAFAA